MIISSSSAILPEAVIESRYFVTGESIEQDFRHWVQPMGYDRFEWAAMEPWLIETFGPGGWWEPKSRWVGSSQRYWFRKEADRMLFILKWSRD